MFNTERQRHDVHVLFGDVNYDIRNAHWRVNNKIKRKFTLFQWIPSKIFILCNENIQIRTRENTDVFITLDDNIYYGIHRKRVNILYISDCTPLQFGLSLCSSHKQPLNLVSYKSNLHVLIIQNLCSLVVAYSPKQV